MGHDVFISYTTAEKNEALQVKNVIETNGYSCWMAPESIPGGSSYGKEIEAALRNCKLVVVILSEKAQESIWIEKEISTALGYKKIVVPFHIDESDLHDAFKFYLTDAQRVEAYQNVSKAYKDLIDVLRKNIGERNLYPVDPSSSNPGDRAVKKDDDFSDFDMCKMYYSSGEGGICFYSKKVKSYEDEHYLECSEGLKNGFKTKLIDLLSCLYQIDKDVISVEYLDDRVKLLPFSEMRWYAGSMKNEYRLHFNVKYFEPETKLSYDSVSVNVESDVIISFMFNDDYVTGPYGMALPLSQLGISEETAADASREMLKLCYPGKSIKTQPRFTPAYFKENSGSYHLKYIVN